MSNTASKVLGKMKAFESNSTDSWPDDKNLSSSLTLVKNALSSSAKILAKHTESSSSVNSISESSSSTTKIDSIKPEAHIELTAQRMFKSLRDEVYVAGELSIVDREIESLLIKNGESFVIKLMNKLSLLCYGSDKELALSHYLNVLKNLSFHTQNDALKVIVLSALGHRSLLVKEAAIAIFEGWDYCSAEEIQESINLLKNIDTMHINWLDEYRVMVISDLAEELGEHA